MGVLQMGEQAKGALSDPSAHAQGPLGERSEGAT